MSEDSRAGSVNSDGEELVGKVGGLSSVPD